MSDQHTPGPWDVSDVQRDREFLIHNGATDIAVTYWALGDCAANARLIAASPKMLSALRAAAELIDYALPKFDWGKSALDGKAIQLLNEVPMTVRAAIAKATLG